MDTTIDTAYQSSQHVVSQMSHAYGPNVHILSNPILIHLINTISSTSMTHPSEIASYLKHIYRYLLYEALPIIAPLCTTTVHSRMTAYTPRAIFQSIGLDQNQRFICAALARGGILPAQSCFEELLAMTHVLHVRQDHFFCERSTDPQGNVDGSHVIGAKVGGGISDSIVLIPDPMGATGYTLDSVIQHYSSLDNGIPKAFVGLHMIVTPEYLAFLRKKYANLVVVAGRLDRGLSTKEVLNTPLGSNLSHEIGLTEKSYVVPGVGGIGELLNNTL